MSFLDRLTAQKFKGLFVDLGQQYDVERLVTDTEFICKTYGLGRDLPQLCLTSRPNSENPLLDGAGSLLNRGLEGDFTHFNSHFNNTIFRKIYEELPFPVGRVRLMFLEPGKSYSMHMDSEPRLHIAIKTNKNALITIRNSFGDMVNEHIPANGSLWWIDTTKMHTATNNGSSDRIHLVASILI